MALVIIAFLGGLLTVLSPCILPVLPFVFARAGRPFVRNALPMLTGMALTFALVATLAAVGGGWAVQATVYGRRVALVFMLVFGAALVWPTLAERLARPLVALGNRLAASRVGRDGGPASSLLLGIATGLLWAPCAGPILGLVLTGAALRGANVGTSLLLLAYASGNAVSLAAALLLGGRAFALMKRSLGAEVWLRRAAGGAVVAGALAIGMGLDTGLLARISTQSTTRLEERLLGALGQRGTGETPRSAEEAAAASGGSAVRSSRPVMMSSRSPAMSSRSAAMSGRTAHVSGGSAMTSIDDRATGAAALPIQGRLPALEGAGAWLNSEPLTAEALRGRVVLVDFWTYSCINCIRTLPYVEAWYEKYRDQGLVVIGVHTPEFSFEKRLENVRRAIGKFGVTYPVAVDNDYSLWRAFSNRYWPAHYFIDAAGNIRHTHFGEGEYEESERVIQQLLAEAGHRSVSSGTVGVSGIGAALASNELDVLSPETYVGYGRARNFASPGGQVRDAARAYSIPARLALNDWALEGIWNVHEESASLEGGVGRIVFHFEARDLHLVLGPGPNGKPVRFRVSIDGAPPGDEHGTDVDANGDGRVSDQRLYQLIRQQGNVRDRVFEIEFLDDGAEVYAFTFG